VAKTSLNQDSGGYLMPGIRALLTTGWRLARIPEAAKVPNNKSRLVLRTDNAEYRYRLLVYAVSSSSRGRPDERRVEVTSTYLGGNLEEDPTYRDVVLGWERQAEVYIGIDSRRLREGGETHNASTFVSLAGIQQAPLQDGVLVLPRPSDLFSGEYQAYFRPRALAEYLMNVNRIHRGLYVAPVRRPTRPRTPVVTVDSEAVWGDEVVVSRVGAVRDEPTANAGDVEAVEAGRKVPRRKVSPEEFERILKQAAENGSLGEAHVFAVEKKRLVAGGRRDLAGQVRWVSLESVSEGYDILSYELDGTERYIEVKATQGEGQAFPITLNEWRVARMRKAKYAIARVTNVRERPDVRWLHDPARLHANGALVLDASGWLVTYE
jgi:hypothetical protein